MSYNVDEPWKQYAKWKKPIKEGYITYESTYVHCPEKANLRQQKGDLWLPEAASGEWGVPVNGYGVTLGGYENVL